MGGSVARVRLSTVARRARSWRASEEDGGVASIAREGSVEEQEVRAAGGHSRKLSPRLPERVTNAKAEL